MPVETAQVLGRHLCAKAARCLPLLGEGLKLFARGVRRQFYELAGDFTPSS